MSGCGSRSAGCGSRSAECGGRFGWARSSGHLRLVANLRIHKRRRFRQVLGLRILFSDGPFQLLRILGLYAAPSLFDFRICDPVLHRWQACGLSLEGGRGRNHIELIALPGLTVVRLPTRRRTKCQLNWLDILIGPSRDVLNRRPEVVDHIVVVDNVRDVPGLVDDLNVSLGGHNVPRVIRFAPMRVADKGVSRRSNAIIRVGPGRYRLLHGNVCFGWKRSPAYVFITFPPRDPGRSPLVSRDPAPSGSADIDPAPIMVGCPAKTLVGVPVPAVIGPDPVSVLVRSPIL